MELVLVLENARPLWWIGVAGGLLAAVILIVWWVLLKRVEAFYQWRDDLIHADLSAYKKGTTRILLFLISAFVLTAAGFSVANTLVVDTSNSLSNIGNLAADFGRWLASRLITIIGIGLVSIVIMRVVKVFIPQFVRHAVTVNGNDDRPEDVAKRIATPERVVSSAVSTVVIMMAFFMIISELGVNIAPLLAGAGIIGLALAFGAQNMVRELLAGVFIVMEDQFRVGDVVSIAGVSGLVEDFNLRRTVLRDFDLTVHSMPNGEIKTSSNLTRFRSRVNLNITVAYSEDLAKCIEIIDAVGEEMKMDPKWGPFMNEAIYFLRVENFSSTGVEMKVIVETLPTKRWDVAGEYRLRLKRAFDQAEIEVPTPGTPNSYPNRNTEQKHA
ncbi:MAG: mechanosensitive ion channel family protein [Dehalococcoidia bacterium]|nr:mechanosensitive ion channel family protein [Dehalococcoidia bacterium]